MAADGKEVFHARRLSFGAEAALYDEARPSYPVEAARWMLGDDPLRVVDLGAGTGKFTRVIASLGHDVVAVEPDSGMRERLAESVPGVPVVAGSAEVIPLPAGSIDAVVAAQSYHWFDTELARAEIARVLRPGGVLAPIWNVRDDSVPWVAELSRRVLVGDPSAADHASRVDFGPLFDRGARAEFRHVVDYTASSLLALVRSRSRYLILDASGRRRLDEAVEALTTELPATFSLPYATIAYRAVLADTEDLP